MISLVRPILNWPFFYESYHHLIGADYRNRVLVDQYIKPQEGDRILDIGCGPGNLVPFLPDCDYIGVDANKSYISSAQKRYGNRGKFLCERVSHHNVQQFGQFDIVMAFGLTHHLDDQEALDLFRLGYTALKPGGRMITHDGCYMEGQSAFARYLLRSDRGRFVRTKPAYEKIARTFFQDIQFDIRSDVLKIPYYHLIMVCTR